MSEQTNLETGITQDDPRLSLYRNPDYISLYRFENPNIPYEDSREGVISKKEIIGSWYTNSLEDLKTYTKSRIKGQKGGRFVIVRIRKEDLDNYDATKLSETKEMDIENSNYIIPEEVGANSRVEIEGVFKDSWEGKRNIPFTDWQVIDDYVDANLSDEAIIRRLTAASKPGRM